VVIRGNGAYACINYSNDRRIIYDIVIGTEENNKETTNNRMEIKGLISALELATTKYKNEECIIYCDSAYCVNMFNS
jgi:ribonuclease HI